MRFYIKKSHLYQNFQKNKVLIKVNLSNLISDEYGQFNQSGKLY